MADTEVKDTAEVQESVQEETVTTDTTPEQHEFMDNTGDFMFGSDDEPTGEEPPGEKTTEEAGGEVSEEENPKEVEGEPKASEKPEDITTEPKTEQKVEEKPVVETEDDFALLRSAGYTGKTISALLQLVDGDPEVQKALQNAVARKSGKSVASPVVEVSHEEKTPQDFMPEGKEYSSIEAMEVGTESYKAHSKYTDWRAETVYTRKTTEQQQAYQREQAQKRQIELLQAGKKNLQSQYGVTDEQLSAFGQKLQKMGNVNPLEVAYLGLNFEELSQERVQREAEKLAENMLRTRHNGKTTSAALAETGAEKEKPPTTDDLVEKTMFGE